MMRPCKQRLALVAGIAALQRAAERNTGELGTTLNKALQATRLVLRAHDAAHGPAAKTVDRAPGRGPLRGRWRIQGEPLPLATNRTDRSPQRRAL